MWRKPGGIGVGKGDWLLLVVVRKPWGVQKVARTVVLAAFLACKMRCDDVTEACEAGKELGVVFPSVVVKAVCVGNEREASVLCGVDDGDAVVRVLGHGRAREV